MIPLPAWSNPESRDKLLVSLCDGTLTASQIAERFAGSPTRALAQESRA